MTPSAGPAERLRLVGERDQLEAERKLLRAELLGALAAAAANWRQDERVLSLRSASVGSNGTGARL